MAITVVGTPTNTGNAADSLSRAVAVPTGAAAGHIAVVFLGQWADGLDPGTITAPSGFTQKGAQWTSFSDAKAKNSIWWKRLTAADTGTYTFSWPTSSWTTCQCVLFSGCISTGDPWDAIATPTTGSWGAIASISVTTTDPNGALFWAQYNDTAGTHTPPTGFTEAADNDSGSCAYRIPGTAGSQTATGASISSTSNAGQWLGALLSDTAAVAAPEVRLPFMPAPGRFAPGGRWSPFRGETTPQVAPEVTATAAADLGGLTATATATVDHPASAAASLGALTATATGTITAPGVSGTAAATLGALTAATVADVTHPATAAASLGALTAAMTGTVAWGPPTGLTATPISDTQINLTWDALTGAGGYDIERDSVVIASDVATNSYNDTGLTPNTAYSYRVRAARA